ncbi:hypothetical protein C7B77_00890 [Chamaesiphon polymorphus CCALA 037]|uniref:Uncharacterized protein n=1 Tax=Chamaesiphon polymorphus CCALA 037 TaxID=2107692 RepID=A0A2T1GNC2_9CYAN|nr:hypothetical protein C7B77_00890 [Chamaesiphon polymorphus CCALA 037]
MQLAQLVILPLSSANRSAARRNLNSIRSQKSTLGKIIPCAFYNICQQHRGINTKITETKRALDRCQFALY